MRFFLFAALLICGNAIAASYTQPLQVGCHVSSISQVALGTGGTSLAVACDAVAPPPVPTGTCPSFAGYSRLTGTPDVNYFGDGKEPVDVTSLAAVYKGPWPGSNGLNADFKLPTKNYLSVQFTIPAGAPAWSGKYYVSEADTDARVAMTISRSCGDFKNPATYGATSVVPGCWQNRQMAGGGIGWSVAGAGCVLPPGTYFMNVINADIANAPASAPSTKNAQCASATCQVTIMNRLGNKP